MVRRDNNEVSLFHDLKDLTTIGDSKKVSFRNFIPSKQRNGFFDSIDSVNQIGTGRIVVVDWNFNLDPKYCYSTFSENSH